MVSKPALSFTWAWALLPFLVFIFPLWTESRSISPSNLPKEVPPHQHFEFIKKLEGSHKGETIKGLHQLKQYLMKFGYLPHDHFNTTIRGTDDDDSFDDSLESAIKSYQHNFHLNITGQLDAATTKQMMTPRCGMPDVVNGKSGAKGRHLGFHITSRYTFFPGSPKWPPSKTHLTYGFLPNGVQVIDAQTLSSTCASALAKWSEVTPFTFEEIQDVESADIKIGFFSGDHGDNSPFDGRGGVLAHAYAPTEGLFHFDSDESWAINPTSTDSSYDVESVAVHEIGHLLGLGHTHDPNAIMYPTIPAGEKKVTLAEDDIQGIKALYNL